MSTCSTCGTGAVTAGRFTICAVELLWKHPTPREESLAKIDEFLRTHQFTDAELLDIQRCYGDKRVWALRHLRLTAAANRLRPVRAPYTSEELANSKETWHVNRPAAFAGLNPAIEKLFKGRIVVTMNDDAESIKMLPRLGPTNPDSTMILLPPLDPEPDKSPEVLAAMERLPANLGFVVGDGPKPIHDPQGVKVPKKWDQTASNTPFYPGQPVDKWEGGHAVYWNPDKVTKVANRGSEKISS